MIVRWVLAAALAVLAGTATVDAASLFDPALRFRRISTDHFVIYYHQGAGRLAARLAVIAEETRAAMAQSFSVPSSRTHVVIADQTELANGWATPLPYNTIVLWAAAPAGSDFTGHTEDWLRVLFAHEFAHMAHLDRSGDWARFVRRIFGRMPLTFPNLFLPVWQIEGLATFQESRITGTGRLHSSNFGLLVGEAAAARTPEPLDRINGGLTDWPGSQAPYAYGSGFHAFLADRFGERRLDTLADRSASAVPYAAFFAFEEAFGATLGELWRDYLTSLDRSGAADSEEEGAPVPERLTRHGFVTTRPRFVPRVCDACPPELAYTTQTPHDLPSIQRVTLEGGTPAFLTRRSFGTGLAATTGLIIFDQLEVHRSTALYSDLYALDLETGRMTALTRDARLLDPDLSSDGRSVVAVRQQDGERSLVTLQLARDDGRVRVESMRTLLREPDTQFNAPRWSPRGRRIAVERHRLGRLPEIVLVDADTADVRVLGTLQGHAVVTPAWRPDGLAVLAATDPDGVFQIFEFPVAGETPRPVTPRQLTRVQGGALWPDVSPDGRTLAFIGYTSDGFDVFVLPYPSEGPLRPDLAAQMSDAPERQERDNGLPGSEHALSRQEPEQGNRWPGSTPYRPWHTLRPTYWSPVISLNGDQLRLGAFTSGFDVLQYHGFSLQATLLADVSGPNPDPRTLAPDFDVAYAYSRWWPTLYVSASQTSTLVDDLIEETGAPVRGVRRERAIETGVLVPILRVRNASQWLAAVRRENLRSVVGDVRQESTQHALRAGWIWRSALTHGYSISPERGVELGGTLDWRPSVRDGAVTTLLVDARTYLPGLAEHHVTALRAAGGASFAPAETRRGLFLGGAQASPAAFSFDRDAIGLLRGFPEDGIEATRVAVLNADYRWPLGRPQRGFDTLPFMLHSLHAAAFADAGYAWDHEVRARDVRASAGAELSFDIVAGYRFPLTVTLGTAWTYDRAAAPQHRAAFFARVGRAF